VSFALPQVMLIVIIGVGVALIYKQAAPWRRLQSQYPFRFRNAMEHVRGEAHAELDYIFCRTLLREGEEPALAQDKRFKHQTHAQKQAIQKHHPQNKRRRKKRKL